MKKNLLALLLLFAVTTSYSGTPYLETGELLDIESKTCAIGRPLEEVVSEILTNCAFFKTMSDYITIETSDGNSKMYDLSEQPTSLDQLPELTSQDTLLWVSYHAIMEANEDPTKDTCFVFGLYFNRSTDDPQRTVKLFRGSYYSVVEMELTTPFSINWTISYVQTADTLQKKIAPNYQYKLFSDDCPSPYAQLMSEGDNISSTGKINGNIIKTFTTSFIEDQRFYGKYTYKKTDYIVGKIDYCPIEEEVTEHICQGESYTFGDHILKESCTDTVKTKTWYGADSITVLHLTVNPTVKTTVDTTIYDNQLLYIDGKQITKNGYYQEIEQTNLGCDSIVTYCVTVLSTDTLPEKKDSYYPLVKPEIVVSPNGDGTNDTWQIENLDSFNKYTIRIFDRNGKLLVKYKNNYPGWDGTYNGEKMPSQDYWYSIYLEDVDKNLVGHFTLVW